MTSTQAALAAIWADVLRLDRVEPGDDFFAVGGNSLQAVRMAALVHERLGIEPPLQDLFTYRTLAEFAGRIDLAGQADAGEKGAI
jgi:acyl carrier protein